MVNPRARADILRKATAVRSDTSPSGDQNLEFATGSFQSPVARGRHTNMYDENTCGNCGATSETMHLEKCPICFTYFCADCAYRATGRRLCSERCAMFMMAGDDDDETDED